MLQQPCATPGTVKLCRLTYIILLDFRGVVSAVQVNPIASSHIQQADTWRPGMFYVSHLHQNQLACLSISPPSLLASTASATSHRSCPTRFTVPTQRQFVVGKHIVDETTLLCVSIRENCRKFNIAKETREIDFWSSFCVD
jgi:hypothetical protein